MTDAEKAAADKAAQDKKAEEQAAKDQRAEAEANAKIPVVIVGDSKSGGPFNIYGSGFGASKGSLTIGGRTIDITEWDDVRIHGDTPPNTKGDVVLTTGNGVRRGVFPHVEPTVVKTTTTVVETKPA